MANEHDSEKATVDAIVDTTPLPYPDANAIPFWFTHKQPPTPDQAAKYAAIHDKAREFAEFLISQLPPDDLHSFERKQAFARLEECVYWAVTSVSRSRN